MNSDRETLFRQERTDPARNDQPALSPFSADALMELAVAPRILERAWRQVRRNRGAPGPDGMTIGEFEDWARANWPAIRQQLLDEGVLQSTTEGAPQGGPLSPLLSNILLDDLDKWLEQQGLVSLKQRWSELAPLRGTA